jgi:tol-pal system protein YbgF
MIPMKFNPRLLTCGLPAILFSLIFLSACAPATTSPSAALRQQFETIMQQQQEQAAQLKILQQQLAQLQFGGGAPIIPQTGPASVATLTIPSQLPTTLPSYQPEVAQLTGTANAEITALADAAATYLAAFSNLAAGNFAPAEAEFSLFLRDYPEHQYAPNARYWLASAQAAQNKLQAAMANLRQLVAGNKGQSKAPAAMLLLAKLYRQQDWNNEADEILEQLRSSYPGSPEAQHFYQSAKPQ